MAFKKIDKEFCITDDSVNVYGYRLLTSGLRLDRFNPPIGFLMHDRDKGVAVRWGDFRVEEGKVFARPSVNETAFPGLAQQIEDGFYDAASVGHIVAISMTDDQAMKLEGQDGPTVTEWFPRECSIVDIPGNYHAIGKLFDEADNLLQDLTDKNKSFMEEQTVKVSALELPDLKADATAEDAINAVHGLVEKANKAEKAEKELADLRETMNKEKVDGIIAQALADHKISKSVANRLKEDYAGNPESLKSLVDEMMPQKTITSEIEKGKVPEKYQGKSFNDLYLSGELEEVKMNYPDLYATLKTNK